MAKAHLYPVFHVVLDIGRIAGADLQALVDKAEADLATCLGAVEFDIDGTLSAEFAGSFDKTRAHVINQRQPVPLNGTVHWQDVPDFIAELDGLIDGEVDELAQTLTPIREFLRKLQS